jgi:surface-anchored protein
MCDAAADRRCRKPGNCFEWIYNVFQLFSSGDNPMCYSLNRILGLSLAAAIVMLLSVAKPACADTLPVYASGHCDLCADLESGAMSLHYHFHSESPGKDESGNSLVGEYEASSLLTRVSDATKTTVPTSSAYRFLGASSGSNVWVLSQNNVSGTPYLGFGTEELDPDDWKTGITYKLVSVSGPGQFSMWMSDSFGNPLVYWATSDGIDSSDAYTQAALSHSHANWGFTAEGVYTVQMQISGTLADETTVTSEIETFTFLVGSSTTVPEPGTLALLASCLGSVGLITWRKRRQHRI